VIRALALAGLLAAVGGSPAPQTPAGAPQSPSPMDRATAQAQETPARPADDALAAPRAGGGSPGAPMPVAQDVVLKDPAARQQYLAAMQRYFQYFADGYAYRSRVFEWQLFSSRVIFSVVLLLVAAGMYFAAAQFRVAMTAAAVRAPVEAKAAVDEALTTRLELSAKGIVVNSSVLGVIILALSLAFFYLYLVYVYPIQNVF